jgi:hypothetical protein
MRRALYWLTVLIAVASLAGGAVYAFLGYRDTAGPDGTVKGYFAALARSDAPAALGFGRVPAGPRDLLTSQVLAEQQQIAPLHDVQIQSVARSGSRATVRYSYQLRFSTGNRTVTGAVQVIDGAAGWRMTQTAVATTVKLDQATDRSTFAEAAVPEGRTLLFPGALPIRFDTPYLALTPRAAQVRFGDQRTITLGVRATPAARSRLTAALHKRLTACVSGAPPSVACPLPSNRYVPGSLHGRIVGTLSHQIKFSVSSDAAGSIEAKGSVAFRGRYRRLTYDNITQSRRGEVRLPVRASAYAVAPLALHLDGTS